MDELLIGHIVLAFSAMFPPALLELINYNKTSDFVGYNTPKGLKSQETRKFSVNYAKRALFWSGLATVCVQAMLYFLVGGETAILITALFMTAGMIFCLILTEVQLNNHFDDEGRPKTTTPRY